MSRRRKGLRQRAPAGAWVAVACQNGESYSGRVASWAELGDGDFLLALQDGAGQWRVTLSEIEELEVIDQAEYARRRDGGQEAAITPPQGGG